MLKYLVSLVFGALATLLSACSDDTTNSATPGYTTPISATVITLAKQPLVETYTVTGTLITDDRVEIASRMMGFIKQINVREGDTVSKGQLLLTIDPTELQARLSEARAHLAQAQARLAEAKADLARYRTLFEQKMVAANAFHKVELDYQLAEEAERAAHASLKRVKVQMEYAKIQSPVSGVIVDKMKQTGDMATPGTPILVIENPENIVLKTFIREKAIEHINVGEKARIDVEAAGLITSGPVVQVVPAADPVTRSYLVKIALDNTAGIRTGMFARAEFNIGAKSGIAIPVSAVVMRADLPGVYIVDDQNVAHFRMIRTGRELDGQVEIIAGLSDGEHIITSGVDTIHSGDYINAQPPGENE